MRRLLTVIAVAAVVGCGGNPTPSRPDPAEAPAVRGDSGSVSQSNVLIGAPSPAPRMPLTPKRGQPRSFYTCGFWVPYSPKVTVTSCCRGYCPCPICSDGQGWHPCYPLDSGRIHLGIEEFSQGPAAFSSEMTGHCVASTGMTTALGDGAFTYPAYYIEPGQGDANCPRGACWRANHAIGVPEGRVAGWPLPAYSFSYRVTLRSLATADGSVQCSHVWIVDQTGAYVEE